MSQYSQFLRLHQEYRFLDYPQIVPPCRGLGMATFDFLVETLIGLQLVNPSETICGL